MSLLLLAAGFVWFGDDSEYPDEWDPRVAELAAFVEDERDIEFAHPVAVDFLSEEEYSDETRLDETELTPADRADLEDSVALLRALGLASGEVDLFEASNDLADTGTLAYYDPALERITVRGTEMTVGLEATLAHELTHVLQDQHFDIGDEFAVDPEAEVDDAAEARFQGFQALVEGDAVRIEDAYLGSLSSDELDEYLSEYQEGFAEAEEELAEVPAVLQASQAVPYTLGQPLVDLIATDGGNAAVDDAFDRPPSTTEHMLTPLSYFASDEPTDLDDPEPPDDAGDTKDSGEMGATDIYLLLAERIDPQEALDAADGWGNARYLTYEQDDRDCVRLAVDGDTATDDDELAAAFTAWTAAAPPESGATNQDLGDGHTEVTSCDPGATAAAINNRAMDVLNLPIARSQLALLAVDTGTAVAEAWTQGDCVVRQLSLEQVVAANESAELDPALQEVVDNALTTCGIAF